MAPQAERPFRKWNITEMKFLRAVLGDDFGDDFKER